ncbi:hypothetical protein [Bartonella sp. AU18XJBT]|uniref:hypothetical protein n=1 Tax=Bartonella sp. AU18XJBT TaxID=3019089 RepID=UPI002360058D|nr:hypothetical protein [Bartonella sp. AU18XJBT]
MLFMIHTGGIEYSVELKKIAFSLLPHRILAILMNQKMSITPRPYLVFENLPIDRKINTSPNPYNLDASCKSGYISENLIMMFSLLIGEPYSIKFEGEHIVNNLVPLEDNKKDYTGLGSEVELDFHIENAALKFIKGLNLSPKGILLTGVRNDVDGPLTRISDARLALKLLSEEDLGSLRDNLYIINVPYRWRKNGPPLQVKCSSFKGTVNSRYQRCFLSGHVRTTVKKSQGRFRSFL